MFEGDISQGEQETEFPPRKEFEPNEKINIVMDTDTQNLSFEKFCGKVPRFSMALDGYAKGVTKLDENGPWMNIDHHSEETKSTAAQIEEMLLEQNKLYSLEFFEENGKIRADVYVNHCDEDVCLSLFLLKYSHIPEIINHEKMQRLVKINDNLDTTGGMYPYTADSPDLKEVTWVMEPYQQFMLNKGTAKKYPSPEDKNKAYMDVAGQVEERIFSYLKGEAEAEIEQYKPNTSFKIIPQEKYNGWVFVKDLGAQGRAGMALEGIKAYVYLKSQEDGKFYYSIGRLAEAANYFDLPELYEEFNKAEGSNKTDDNQWGGGPKSGGCPPMGSTLSPERMIDVITPYINKKKSLIAS